MATTILAPPTTHGKQSRTLKWAIPRWSRARELSRVAPLIFSVGPIIRIIGASLAIGALLCVGVRVAFPQVQFDFVWRALIGIPTTFALVGVNFPIHILFPGYVKITKTYLICWEGQSGWRVELSGIQSSKLVVYSQDHLRLIVHARDRTRKVALPSTVDLRELTMRLNTTVISDKRAEFRAAQALVHHTKSCTD